MLTSSKILKGINGIAKIPSDKSISHRSVIIPSITNGSTEVNNILKSEDVFKTINAFKLLGVKIEEKNNIVSVILKRKNITDPKCVKNNKLIYLLLKNFNSFEKLHRTGSNLITFSVAAPVFRGRCDLMFY